MQCLGFRSLFRRSVSDPKIRSVLYVIFRGKKWKPFSEDTENHENYGFYLKRWRRRNLRGMIINETSNSEMDGTLRLERPSYRKESNIDMFHTDTYHQENMDSEYAERAPRKKTKARSGTKRKTNRRTGSSSTSSNYWTHNLRNTIDDEWDWDDLRMMYGHASDDEADVEDAFAPFKSSSYRRSNENETPRSPPYLTPECTSHLRVLGLPITTSVTAKDLKEAFYKCALQWHPDRHDKDQKAHAATKFKQVQEAYKALQSRIQEQV